MRYKLTIEEIEAKKMSDKDRWIAMIINYPGSFANQNEEIQYHMREGQLHALVDAKMRLPINESLFLANGFEKVEGMGDDDYYIYELKTPTILGEQQTLTYICFKELYGYKGTYDLFVENRSIFSTEGVSPADRVPIYNRCEVMVQTIQQAEDTINATGFPFNFSLKGYNPKL